MDAIRNRLEQDLKVAVSRLRQLGGAKALEDLLGPSGEHWSFADYDDDDKLVDSGAINTNPPTVYGFGHEGYYRNVLAVLRGDAKPETDGRAGRKSLEIILGIYESARTGAEVSIPLTVAP